MTVAIGLACKGGVLVASDSMASSQSVAMTATKVWTLDRQPVLWSAAGAEYVVDEVAIELAKVDEAKSATGGPAAAFAQPDPAAIRGKLRTAVHAGMRRAYGTGLSTTPAPPGAILSGYETDVFVLGYSNGTPWFFEFDRSGQINSHLSRRFAAIGSGGPFAAVALALMSHHVSDELNFDDAKLLAYRTIETTIAISSASVGPPVQIAVCDENGARVLASEELDELRTGVARWKVLESELLLNLKSGSDAEPASGDIPSFGEVVGD